MEAVINHHDRARLQADIEAKLGIFVAVQLSQRGRQCAFSLRKLGQLRGAAAVHISHGRAALRGLLLPAADLFQQPLPLLFELRASTRAAIFEAGQRALKSAYGGLGRGGPILVRLLQPVLAVGLQQLQARHRP
jgi:hypothetical protein